MRRIFFVLACALAAGDVCAQYKCVSPGGGVAFQQTPCATGTQEQKLVIRSSEVPTQPAPVSSKPLPQNVDQRMAASLGQERRVRELQQSIADTEGAMVQRSAQMSRELDILRAKKGYAANNLAGATWEQSISTEMQAVTQKHKTMNDLDQARIKQLRVELAAAQQAVERR